MQRGGSLEGPPLVSASSQSRGRVALPSEQAAPQQAETPRTADQGLGNSNVPESGAPAGASQIQASPAVLAAATGDAPEHKERHESSEGAARASGDRAGKSQAVSSEPLSPQQHAVVVALMVVIKRALLEGYDAARVARQRLLCNNWDTLAVLQFISIGRELPSIEYIEQMLQIEAQDLLDSLARQCVAAGFQPLQVFGRSVQCEVAFAYKAAQSRGEAAVLARHQQVAELDRAFVKHSFPSTWGKTTTNLLMRQGVSKRMAELIMLLPLLLEGLCKQCFRPSDTALGGAVVYAALDHLLPGSCHLLDHVQACDTSGWHIPAMLQLSYRTSEAADDHGFPETLMHKAGFVNGKVPSAGDPLCRHAGAMTDFSVMPTRRSGLQGFWMPCCRLPSKTVCALVALPSCVAPRRRCCRTTRHTLWHPGRLSSVSSDSRRLCWAGDLLIHP